MQRLALPDAILLGTLALTVACAAAPVGQSGIDQLWPRCAS